LLAAYQNAGGNDPVADLVGSVRAVELHRSSFQKISTEIQELLVSHHLSSKDARVLCESWLVRDDYLLAALEGEFSYVVGNPPYLRQESIPQVLIDEYRQRYSTIYDRADLYVPFIERSLRLLAPGGALGFICADRWMKNRYGGPLRRLHRVQITGG